RDLDHVLVRPVPSPEADASDSPVRGTMGGTRGISSESERCIWRSKENSSRCKNLGWGVHGFVVGLRSRSGFLGFPRFMAATTRICTDFGDGRGGSACGFQLVEHSRNAVRGRRRIRALEERS